MTPPPESRHDRLEGKLIFTDDPLQRGVDAVLAIERSLETHGFTPTWVNAKGRKKYSHRTFEQILRAPVEKSVNFALTDRTVSDWRASFTLRGNGPSPLGGIINLSVTMREVEPPARVQAVIDLVRQLCANDRPIYGYLHSGGDFELGGDPHLTDSSASKEVRDAYWLLVLGADMVEQLGRERVMSAPAARIEPLPQGGVLLVTTESPVNVTSPESRRAQAAVLAHLRPEITVEQSLARYAERDRQLAPVAKDWDPDLVDVLERLCDQVTFGNRQREIEKYNGYRAAAVDERRSPPLPSDVANPAAAIERYDMMAEQLVALLHDKIDAIGKRVPDTLPEIDFRFWLYDYPRRSARSDIDRRLIPAVGAYLGMLLVDHLGGTWVPRQHLDESQVVIGDIAWLPFVRARRYLQSMQTALDYSLTKFYRTVART